MLLLFSLVLWLMLSSSFASSHLLVIEKESLIMKENEMGRVDWTKSLLSLSSSSSSKITTSTTTTVPVSNDITQDLFIEELFNTIPFKEEEESKLSKLRTNHHHHRVVKRRSSSSRYLQSSLSQQACAIARVQLEREYNIPFSSYNNGQDRVRCTCTSNMNVDGYDLVCTDACRYCNNDQSICGLESFGVTFSNGVNGGIIQMMEGFTYLTTTNTNLTTTTTSSSSRNERIIMERTGCQEQTTTLTGSTFDVSDVTCTSCQVKVNGVMCDTCSLSTCEDGGITQQAPSFTCEAIEANSSVTTCPKSILSTAVPTMTGSVFEFVKGIVNQNLNLGGPGGEFNVCYFGTGNGTTTTVGVVPTAGTVSAPTTVTSTASPPPVVVPTQAPNPTQAAPPPTTPNPTTRQMGQCPLTIAVNQCGPLIDVTAPVEDCDCYNYCGGVYSGCCKLGEPCGLECTRGPFVAGCRFDGNYEGTLEVGCRVHNRTTGLETTYLDGDSFGNLIETSCGSVDDFPCFCDSQTESDFVRCPYCNFQTNVPGETVCAKDGESIEFTNPQGIQQRCSCNYIADGLAQTGCQAIGTGGSGTGGNNNMGEEPKGVCLLERQTERCGILMEGFQAEQQATSGNQVCDCYNFCGPIFNSCCNFGEACSMECPASQNPYIVAGCTKEALAPTVPVPTTSPPTLMPVPVVCPITQNTERCPTLLDAANLIASNITIPADCECINFCGPNFQGCCPFDGMATCSLNCASLAPGDVLVAGCQLPKPTAPSIPPSAVPTGGGTIEPSSITTTGQVVTPTGPPQSADGIMSLAPSRRDAYVLNVLHGAMTTTVSVLAWIHFA